MINFKLDYIKKELEEAPLLLKIIVNDFADYCYREYDKTVTLTRILEKVNGESGVHQDYRAADVRDEYNGSNMLTEAQRTSLLNYINNKYYRNDGFDTCIWHSFNNGPHHFHIQIAASTKAYMKKGV